MIIFPTNQKKAKQQSLLTVYFQIFLYYDQIWSYFALIFQYLEFIYKYNILSYSSTTISLELVFLSILLIMNPFRIAWARNGNRGKKYVQLILFLVFDVLLIMGYIYVMVLQTNALYLQMIISVLGLIFSATNFALGLAAAIYYRATE